MKIRHMLFVVQCFATSLALAQDTPPPPDVEGLHDFVLADLEVLEWSGGEPYILVLFFDIDHDGIPEALATDKFNDYSGTSGEYRIWSVYQYKDGKWQSGHCKVEGAHSGFSSLTREGQKPTLVSSWSSRSKEDNGETFSHNVFEVTIDGEGNFETTPIPELTYENFATWEELAKWQEPGYIHPPVPEAEKPKFKLEPLGVMKFLPTEKQLSDFKLKLRKEQEAETEENRKERERKAAAEERKRVLVARLVCESNEERFAEWARLDALGATEAEKEAATSRLVAEFEQRLSDALARLAAEGAAGEATASPPSCLWFYLAILPVICVIFCFAWRKLRAKN